MIDITVDKEVASAFASVISEVKFCGLLRVQMRSSRLLAMLMRKCLKTEKSREKKKMKSLERS